MPNNTNEKEHPLNLKKGMLIKGKVKNIKPFGAFVEVADGVFGLLHLEDVAISRIKSPEDILTLGSTYTFKVKNYDKDTGRLILNYKDLQGTWEENVKDYKEKTTATGIVRNKEKAGVFIELKPNLVGLAEYKANVSYGDKVNVFIKKISPETKKIKLVILD